MNIKESYNGYWIFSDWMYLDTFDSHIDKKITFDEFTRDFYFYDYENKEWLKQEIMEKCSSFKKKRLLFQYFINLFMKLPVF